MELRKYINSLSDDDRKLFEADAGTTINYLRNAISAGKKIGSDLAIAIDKASGGKVTCEEVRPDVDWAYLRNNPTVNAENGPNSESQREAA